MINGNKEIAMLLHSKGATLAWPDDYSKQLEIWLNEEQSEKQRIEAERIKAEQIKAEQIKAEQIKLQQIQSFQKIVNSTNANWECLIFIFLIFILKLTKVRLWN